MDGVARIPDDILQNILSRLPAKPMGRCRCVSTHWNRLISDHSFMISRSSKIFLCSGSYSGKDNPVHILDESSGSIRTLDFSMFKIPTIRNPDDRFVSILGTFSGIIVLSVMDIIAGNWEFANQQMILYNPFTDVYDTIYDPYSPLPSRIYVYGFGYGATPDDLKIIRFRNYNRGTNRWGICDVFSLKTRSWSQQELIQDIHFKDKIELQIPDSATNEQNHLGTCNGCLWMITNTSDTHSKFDVWVKNEQGVENSWSKTCSFTIGLEPHDFVYRYYYIIEINEDGRIIMNLVGEDGEEMIICDTSKSSYRVLKSASRFEKSSNFKTGVRYKESLISPKNICRV